MDPKLIHHSLHWRHNDHDGVSNHQPHGCLLNRLFGRRSKKTSKLRVTGLCAGNSPRTGEFPAQRASNAENVSIWWRHHDCTDTCLSTNRHHALQYKVILLQTLQWRHNERDGVWNHRYLECLFNGLFRRRSKKTSKLRVTGLCAGNSPGPVNSPHKGPVTRKMFPFDDVIMIAPIHV